jgi:hypothetical protein
MTSLSFNDAYRILLDVSIKKSRKVRGGNYVQLATACQDGLPHCRTVVQRGLFQYQNNSVLKFITDQRSNKVEQIKHQPAGELVWWFMKSSEQYRISGTLSLIGNYATDAELLAVRKQTWGELRDTAREQFYWEQPGVPLDEEPLNEEKDSEIEATTSTLNIPKGGRGEDGKVLPPPDTFLMMLLQPTKVDYLRLTDNNRIVFEKDGEQGWTKQSVNP